MADKKISFEVANKRLEAIVQKMESGTLTLQQSIDEYAKGCELIAYCMKELETRRGEISDINERIKQLRENGGDFNV
ncbi:MAG: exodeoxyribonuclease VII small subunit [Ruminococcus sp.]|nr:exodeoxyribonuclease VII small subunit [Ruminococcus sp.]